MHSSGFELCCVWSQPVTLEGKTASVRRFPWGSLVLTSDWALAAVTLCLKSAKFTLCSTGCNSKSEGANLEIMLGAAGFWLETSVSVAVSRGFSAVKVFSADADPPN